MVQDAVTVPNEAPVDVASQVSQILRYRSHPVAFVKEVLGVVPDEEGKGGIEDYQEDILQAAADYDRVAIHTGHGVGKTALAAWLVLWFIFCWGPCKVVTTAPSWRQVEDLLWAEVHKWVRRAKLKELLGWEWDFKLLDTRLEILQEWYATGEASDDPQKMEGYHAQALLYVFDEAKAIPDGVFESTEGALTGENSKWIQISTPGKKQGYFYKACSGQLAGWKVFHVNGLDSRRVSKAWAEAREKDWGKDSAVYVNRVLGMFADSDDDTLLPLDWLVEAADNRARVSRTTPKVIAVDVANQGNDETVISFREGLYIHDQEMYKKMRNPTLVRLLIQRIRDLQPEFVVIDANGVGAGTYDDLLGEQAEGNIPYTVTLIPFMGASKPSDTNQFLNRRAELWWHLRMIMQPTGFPPGIPNDLVLHAQLNGIRYFSNQKELIQIESKETTRRRGEASPDRADSLALLFAGELPDIEVDEEFVGHTITVTSTRRAHG